MDRTALIFDLDGTLVDSVYEHVAAWHVAFASHDILIPAYEYHKRVGMTGDALVAAISEAFLLHLPKARQSAINQLHEDEYHRRMEHVTPLPDIAHLWETLSKRGVRWAIATSSGEKDARRLMEIIGCPSDAVLVTKQPDTVSKPSPDVFDQAAKRLQVDLDEAMIVGDSPWDMLASRRSGALGVGVLTGGYGREELVAAGAYRVYSDVVEMSRRLIELGL